MVPPSHSSLGVGVPSVLQRTFAHQKIFFMRATSIFIAAVLCIVATAAPALTDTEVHQRDNIGEAQQQVNNHTNSALQSKKNTQNTQEAQKHKENKTTNCTSKTLVFRKE